MIERFPDGTLEIPHPHKFIHWKDGKTTLMVEIPPRQRRNPPKIEGWEPYFVGFFGYDAPYMNYSYRPVHS